MDFTSVRAINKACETMPAKGQQVRVRQRDKSVGESFTPITAAKSTRHGALLVRLIITSEWIECLWGDVVVLPISYPIYPNRMVYPTLEWIRETFRWSRPRVRRQVLEAFVVGSRARGTATTKSDLDIAVIIKPVHGKTALQVTAAYHGRFTREAQKPQWEGMVVDFEFFYPNDPELQRYSKIPLNR